MKNAFIAVGAAFLAGSLSLPLPAATVLPIKPDKALVADDFSELVQAMGKIQKSRAEINKSRKQLERDILNQKNRISFKSDIVKNKNIIAAYRGEALDEAEFLRAHRRDLTGTQRDTVAQAWIDLEEESPIF